MSQPEVLTRSAPIVDTDTSARTLTVQLLAWDDPRLVVDQGGRPYRERWARDALIAEDRLLVWDEHGGKLIGEADPPTDAGPGPVSTLRIAAGNTFADNALALVDAGVIRDVSIEFRPDPAGEVWNADRTEVTRTRATFRGLAFAALPAHDAPILQREEPDMTDTITETPAPEPAQVETRAEPGELEAIRAELVRLRERPTQPAMVAAPYESLGHAMRAALDGQLRDSEWNDSFRGAGVFLHRAIVDMTTGDVPGLIPRPSINRFFQTIVTAQPLVEAAGSVPLPDAGMDVTVPSITSRPSVAQQVTEKTDIASVKIGVARLSAPVITLAGGEDTSAQLIARSDPSYLTLLGQLYAEAMAKATDAYAYARYDAATLPAGHNATIGTDPKLWVQNIANLAGLILKDSGRLPNRLVLSVDLWQKLVGAADADGRPLFPNTAPTNPAGESSLTSTDGNIRGLAFSVDPNLPTDRGCLFNSEGFVCALGAVQTMTADTPTKLGRDYAIFRYGAVIAADPPSMVHIASGTAPTMAEASSSKSK